MATTAPSDGTQDVTASDVAKQVTASLGSADDLAMQRTKTLGLVHQARLSQATRNVAALTAQYGASDPRVAAAQAVVTATQTTIARVSILQNQQSVPTVQVAAKGWALQGFVLDTQYKPQAKYTVYIADSSNEFLPQYGFSYTDDTGYFAINYPGDVDAGTSNAAAAPALFIGVVDAKANPVYLGATAFHPVLGAATFQTIYIPAGGQTLGDPSQAIREVAFPAKSDAASPKTSAS